MNSSELDNAIQLAIEHKYVDADSVLQTAIQNNDLSIVKVALDNGAAHIKNAMFAACRMSRINIIELLLNYTNSNVSKNELLNAGLDNACTFNVAQCLIKNGAIPRSEHLHNACNTCNVFLIKHILEHDKTCVYVDHGILGLCSSVSSTIQDEIEIMGMLANHKIYKIDACAKDACRYNKLEILKILIQRGANNFNECLLHYVASYYYNVSCYNYCYYNPILTDETTYLNMVKLLIDSGADNHDKLSLGVTTKLLNMNCSLQGELATIMINKRHEVQRIAKHVINEETEIRNYDINITNIILDYVPYEL